VPTICNSLIFDDGTRVGISPAGVGGTLFFPQRQLDVFNGGAAQLRLTQGVDGSIGTGGGGVADVYTDFETMGSGDLVIRPRFALGGSGVNPARNVGIDVAGTPQAKLDVEGNLRIGIVGQDLTNSLNQVLVLGANNIVTWRDASTIGGGGLGMCGTATTNYVTKFTGIGTATPQICNTMIFDNDRYVGISPVGISFTPSRQLDILHSTEPQLRLSEKQGGAFTDFQATVAGNLNIIPMDNTSTTPRLGFVGIHQPSPQNTLDINSNIANASGLRFSQLNSGFNPSTVTNRVLSVDGGGNVILVTTPGGVISGGVGICNSMSPGTANNFITKFSNPSGNEICKSIIYDNGTNVGISRTSPARKLDVFHSTQPQLRLTNFDGPTFPIGPTMLYTDFQTTQLGDLIISPEKFVAFLGPGGGLERRNVGIGVTGIPQARLEVNGDVMIKDLFAPPNPFGNIFPIVADQNGRLFRSANILNIPIVCNPFTAPITVPLTGATNFIPRFTNSIGTAMCGSQIFDNGVSVGINTTTLTLGGAKLEVFTTNQVLKRGGSFEVRNTVPCASIFGLCEQTGVSGSVSGTPLTDKNYGGKFRVNFANARVHNAAVNGDVVSTGSFRNYGGMFQAVGAVIRNVGVWGSTQDCGTSTGGLFEAPNWFRNIACHGRLKRNECSTTSLNLGIAGLFDGNLHYYGNFGSLSDITLKQNVQTINGDSAITLLDSMNPISYVFNQASFPQINLPSGLQFGLSAQAIEGFLPNIVQQSFSPQSFDTSGNLVVDSISVKMIDYIKIIPLLIASNKRLNERLKVLEECNPCGNNMRGQGGNNNNPNPSNKTQVTEKEITLTGEVSWLGQNIPNPFGRATTVPLFLAQNVKEAQLIFYDITGKTIQVVDIEERGDVEIQSENGGSCGGDLYV